MRLGLRCDIPSRDVKHLVGRGEVHKERRRGASAVGWLADYVDAVWDYGVRVIVRCSYADKRADIARRKRDIGNR